MDKKQEVKKQKHVTPSYLKKGLSLMNKTSTKGLQIKEQPKTDVTKKEGHQGSTAAFLVQETSDAINAIRAKLESAERRTGISYGKGAKVQ